MCVNRSGIFSNADLERRRGSGGREIQLAVDGRKALFLQFIPFKLLINWL